RVEDIAAFLSNLGIGAHGAVFLVDTAGKRLVSPNGEYVEAAAAAVDAASKSSRKKISADPLYIDLRGDSYEVAFAPVSTIGNVGLSIAVVLDSADITRNF